MNYVLLNGIVLVIVSVFCYLYFIRHKEAKRNMGPFWGTLAAVLGLTAIFDSLIIAAGIVGYDTGRILGIYIGRAPIEDFAYAAVSVMLVVLLWEYYEHRQ